MKLMQNPVRGSRSMLLAGVLAMACATTALVPMPVAAQQGGTLAQAQAAYVGGSYRRANDMLKALAAAQPRSVPVRLLQAQVYLAVGAGIAAQTSVEAARQSGANRDETRPLMAEALMQQRRYADALQEADATKVPPAQLANAARVRGLAYFGMKQNDKALQELLTADKLAPRDAMVKLALGQFYGGNRDLVKAEAAIDAALQAQPGNIKAMLIKGDIVRAKPGGGMTKALPFFNQALQIDPDSVEALIERAATYVDMRREPEALQDIRKLMALAPEHPIGLYLQAVMATRKSRFADAQGLMSRTKGVLDSYPPALMLQGLIAYEGGNMEQATAFLGKVLEAAPNSAVARRLMGAALLRRGNADEAIAMLKPLFDSGQADSRLLSLMGSAYARKQDFAAAVKYYEEAVQAEPASTPIRTQLAMARLALGQTAQASQDLQKVLAADPKSLQAMLMSTLIDLRTRNFKNGLANAQKLVGTYPNLPIAHNMLGAAYLGAGDLKNAEKYFLSSLEKKPDYHEARRNLAQLYLVTKRYEDARRELNKVLASDRNNVRTMLALGEVARAQGRQDEFLQWLQKAVAVDPKALPPRLQLVSAYMRTGDKSRALNEISAVNREFPDNAVVLETMGKVQMANNMARDGITTFQQLVNKLPNSIAAYQLLGRAQWTNKDRDGARRTFQRALGISNAQGRALLLMDMINLEAESGNFESALSYAAEMRKAFPNLNLADKVQGDLYSGNRQWDKAVVAYEAAAKISFDKPLALSLARAYTRLNQPARATATLARWQAGKPFDNGIALASGQIFIDTGNYAEAAKKYEAVMGRGQADAFILNNLAWSYDKLNDPRALATAQRAYKVAPDSPQVQDTLGWLLVRKGDKQQGLLLIQRAAEKIKDPSTQYHLAYAMQANGRVREASAMLNDLLTKNKSFPEIAAARALLAQLKGAPAR